MPPPRDSAVIVIIFIRLFFSCNVGSDICVVLAQHFRRIVIHIRAAGDGDLAAGIVHHHGDGDSGRGCGNNELKPPCEQQIVRLVVRAFPISL